MSERTITLDPADYWQLVTRAERVNAAEHLATIAQQRAMLTLLQAKQQLDVELTRHGLALKASESLRTNDQAKTVTVIHMKDA